MIDRRWRIKELLLVAALGLAFGTIATAALAEVAAWDQTRVTAIAGQLSEATEKAYEVLLNDPAMQDSGAFQEMKDSMRRIHEEARALSGHLDKGKGHDETVGLWKSLSELERDVRVDAQESFETNDVTTELAKVEDLLRQLAPYYDPKANAKTP